MGRSVGRPLDGAAPCLAHREVTGHSAQHLRERPRGRLCEFQFVRCDLGVHQDRPQVVDDRPRMGYQVVNMLAHRRFVMCPDPIVEDLYYSTETAVLS
jgi:hypothetical protein